MPTPRLIRPPTWARAVLACGALLAAPAGWAAENWQRGNISEVTTTARGLMIRLDSGLPTNCTGTSLGWMLIPEANKTMVSTTLLLWIMGRRTIDVYTSAASAGDSYCSVTQVDPVE